MVDCRSRVRFQSDAKKGVGPGDGGCGRELNATRPGPWPSGKGLSVHRRRPDVPDQPRRPKRTCLRVQRPFRRKGLPALSRSVLAAVGVPLPCGSHRVPTSAPHGPWGYPEAPGRQEPHGIAQGGIPLESRRGCHRLRQGGGGVTKKTACSHFFRTPSPFGATPGKTR